MIVTKENWESILKICFHKPKDVEEPPQWCERVGNDPKMDEVIGKVYTINTKDYPIYSTRINFLNWGWNIKWIEIIPNLPKNYQDRNIKVVDI